MADVVAVIVELVAALILLDIILTSGTLLQRDDTACVVEGLGTICPHLVLSMCLLLTGLIHFKLLEPVA